MGFNIKDILHNKAATLLHLETDPGLGCTEPAAIGLSAAAGASLLGNRDVDSIDLTVDANIYKNAMGVIIPSSDGNSGLDLAAAMGAAAGDPKLRLQVFGSVDAEGLARAKELLDQGKVAVSINKEAEGLYVKTVLKAGGKTAEARTTGTHDNIDELALDGRPVKDSPLMGGAGAGGPNLGDLESWLMGLTMDDLVSLLDDLDKDDLGYVRHGLELNRALSDYGLKHGPGIAVGKTQLSLIRQGLLKKDMPLWAGIRAAAGIDSRMGGAPLAAMTLAGSGNQGIAASMPVDAAGEFASIEDPELVLKAVTLSYLVTCTIKAHVGRLSALCGSGVAGGAGVAAGVAYLLGGTTDKIGGAVKNHIENFTAVICDGAKTSCALKVGEAAASGVKNALLALNGCIVRPVDGIIEATAEKTMANVGSISRKGLSSMDPAILGIMLNKPV